MFLSYSVIPEDARLGVRFHCSFGAPGWFQVKMVVAVAHTKPRLWKSRDFIWAKEVYTGGRRFRDAALGAEGEKPAITVIQIQILTQFNPADNSK